MDVAGEVEVLGLPASQGRSGIGRAGGGSVQEAGDGVREPIRDVSEAQAATLIQANFRGSQLRRQLAADDEDEHDETKHQCEDEDRRTALVIHGLLSFLQHRD